MRTAVRLKLDTVARVLGFCRHHPDLTPAGVAAIARLECLLHEAHVILERRRLAAQEAESARKQREEIAGPMRQRLSHLMRLAGAAAVQEGLPAFLASVPLGASREGQLLAAARAAVTIAMEHQALLLRYGMPERLLEELAQDLERYAPFQPRRSLGGAPRSSACAALTALAGEALIVVQHLDALNRIRFVDDPERLAEWVWVRTIRWGSQLPPPLPSPHLQPIFTRPLPPFTPQAVE